MARTEPLADEPEYFQFAVGERIDGRVAAVRRIGQEFNQEGLLKNGAHVNPACQYFPHGKYHPFNGFTLHYVTFSPGFYGPLRVYALIEHGENENRNIEAVFYRLGEFNTVGALEAYVHNGNIRICLLQKSDGLA